ncbi:MAG: TolC family protein [Candidatus Electrothrix aestuarii]|uniref:TolC family protein n=1 Tax=Candidatus Electrothrix aestuarii TaxID=3062594 RepID=A0AAU8LW95_9BACT|nr:TolC family protein [Candidatus Electrothrix aestuarii]
MQRPYFFLFTPLFLAVMLSSSPATCWARKETATKLTLEEAIERALQHNRQLKSSTLDLSSRQVYLDEAWDRFSVQISPLSSINYSAVSDEEQVVWKVGSEISKKFSNGIQVGVTPNIAVNDDSYGTGISCSLAVPLLRGYGQDVNLNTVQAREYSLHTAFRRLHRYKINTVLETVQAVYALIRAQYLVDLYTEQLSPLQGHLHTARIREKAGIGRSMDGYRAELRLKKVEEQLNSAQKHAAETADRLKDLLALPLDKSIEVQAPLEYTLINIKLNEAIQIALQHRIEIGQGRADIVEARRKEKVAEQNTLPDLELKLGYKRQSEAEEFENFSFPDEEIWSVALTSSTDWKRSTEKAALANSRLAVDRSRLGLESSREKIIREVRTVLNALDASRARIALRREQIHQATGKQRLAKVKFQYNEADNFDLLEAETQLEQAKVDLMTDEIRYITDGYRFRAAMGTLIAFAPSNKDSTHTP